MCSFGLKDPEVKKRPLVTKWCYNDTETAGDFVFGEKLIKKDRNPKSNKFKHKAKAIPPSAAPPPLISRNPLVVPKIHNEVIDEPRVNEDVNDKKKPKKPSIFGNKLISQSLLPPKLPSNDLDRPAKKKEQNKKAKQNVFNEQKTKDDGFSEFIDDFINTGNNRDPESPKIDKSNTEDDIVDAELISDVFRFEDDIKRDEDIKRKKDEKDTSGFGKIDFLTREESIPDLGSLAKVVNHDGDSPVSKTIIIQNTPRAHKAFGVKNPPRKFSNRHRASHQKPDPGKSKADADQGESKGPAKSISRDQKNDHVDFLFGVHGADGGGGIIAEQPSHFGFGISEISDEEKEQYR